MSIGYDNDNDFYTVYNPAVDFAVDFVRIGGLYGAEKGALAISHNSVLLTTSEDKKKQFSARAVQQADAALDS